MMILLQLSKMLSGKFYYYNVHLESTFIIKSKHLAALEVIKIPKIHRVRRYLSSKQRSDINIISAGKKNCEGKN